jgi:hypothetical protein
MRMYDVFRMFKAITELQAIKKASWEFLFWLLEIKKKINCIVKDEQDKQRILQEKLQDLAIQYCTKDRNGKPIIEKVTGIDKVTGKEETDEVYTGLSKGLNPEYDKRVKEIVDANRDLLNTEFNVSFEGIKKLERGILEKKNKDGEPIIPWDGNYEEIFHELIAE